MCFLLTCLRSPWPAAMIGHQDSVNYAEYGGDDCTSDSLEDAMPRSEAWALNLVEDEDDECDDYTATLTVAWPEARSRCHRMSRAPRSNILPTMASLKLNRSENKFHEYQFD